MTMNEHCEKLRLGTRASTLAMIQANIISRLVGNCDIVKIVSQGDKITGPLREHGGKGLFTGALENSLRDKTIDLAVHSAKDVPTVISDEFRLFFLTNRIDCGEVLVSNSASSLGELPSGAVVGTCSLRRQNQLLNIRDDLKIVSIRGNVETRIKKVLSGEVDAAVLAKAGLIRSGLIDEYKELITEIPLLPAAGQGALAVEVLSQNIDLCSRLEKLEHAETKMAVTAERYVLEKLNADCRSSVAVNISQDGLTGKAMTSRPDGSEYREFASSGTGHFDTAENLLARIVSLP